MTTAPQKNTVFGPVKYQEEEKKNIFEIQNKLQSSQFLMTLRDGSERDRLLFTYGTDESPLFIYFFRYIHVNKLIF